jgi:hypothetical protein
MRNLGVLFIHFIAVLARLLGPCGVRSIVAESLLFKHQLLSRDCGHFVRVKSVSLANCNFASHRACNNVTCLVLLNLPPLSFELDVADS